MGQICKKNNADSKKLIFHKKLKLHKVTKQSEARRKFFLISWWVFTFCPELPRRLRSAKLVLVSKS